MADNDVGTVEMAQRLSLSKTYTSMLKDGHKPITPRVARALAHLTGKPWWQYMPENEAAQ